MRDGIELARDGLPVVVVVTQDFEDQAHFVAKALGMEGVPIVTVPHPMAGRGADFLQEVARDSAKQVVGLLQGDARDD